MLVRIALFFLVDTDMTVSLTKPARLLQAPGIWSCHLFLSILQHPRATRILLNKFMENLPTLLSDHSRQLIKFFIPMWYLLILACIQPDFCDINLVNNLLTLLSKFLHTDPTVLLGYKCPLGHADSESSPVLSWGLSPPSDGINWFLNKISHWFNFCPVMA